MERVTREDEGCEWAFRKAKPGASGRIRARGNGEIAGGTVEKYLNMDSNKLEAVRDAAMDWLEYR